MWECGGREKQNLNKKYSTILRLPLIIKLVKKKLLNEGEVSFFYKYLNFIRLPIYPFIYPGCYYKPIEIDYACNYILNLINNKKNYFVNLQGKYQMSSYDMFSLVCNQKKKKCIKLNLYWLQKIVPDFIKEKLYTNKYFQQILSLDNTNIKNFI